MKETREFREFEEKVIQIKRVSKKTSGGNSIGFSALVVVGDKKGRAGVGLGKAKDVSSAVQKAVTQAKRNMVKINLKNTTIAHEVHSKFGSAVVFLKPAPKGSGIIAGGAVRVVLELVGIKDISAKMLGSNNRSSNLNCALEALKKLKS
ncbi:30S ribosomal protein S5 [candidate division WWE3 bacterium RIFCSPHIGHO2_12_FULL_38_15]|uniref:Small ribosomal subunit protein uS5 n=1 Tax=candidate division WWE3 bacterium RIFCSPHIGHO2_02_FULL_38_14 TaxID=1802620 RepID=A0A1F4VB53_UNCKA|nr:MAG: 30S ribosomal protein S5 [candidate division WWE3 bacterium RIFCSPHIGHO2_01_FULL_38_45]OGC49092.1 MAG: 30S ribosomal protein S5 [candidate division WWE3 bacterium RIFCSPHIGHO2_12_FULL_38_15]OGC53547.1 MAG: 30S ribosomal protein S5 [candidate division WWE3 bacterium RIFCSPLOWO2_01_FULL_37_24]OGC54451.1 MAG: 30S ribosomal protein S5 [candidate division WWE3 bacterium RIFCSPHIGHO2_02_FULL_38_14]HLB51697.1 30S ribosomal protein S5 [Patescibacteria group bacterium]